MIRRPRAFDRIMEGLAASDRDFILEWLASHGAEARDDLFLPAAMTARLIIEQRRTSNELREILSSDIAALRTETSRARAVADDLRVLQETMREETLHWEKSAREGLAKGLAAVITALDRRVDAGAQKLTAAVESPIKPLVARLEELPTLASAKADEAARKGVAAGVAAMGPTIVAWFRPRAFVIAVAFAVLTVAASYFAGRWSEAHSRAVPVPKHVDARRHR
jgi:hypothetical protein